jgi:hypothetical protein
MAAWCEEIQADIGEHLRHIGATFLKHSLIGEGWQQADVCFYAASDKIIAISHAPRDGFTCFIGDAGSAELSQYETWPTLWHRLGMIKNIDTDEGLDECLRQFPDGYDDCMKFMGACLIKYFTDPHFCSINSINLLK